MANVFGILTAIVLALSAFIAFKNKARYETQAELTQTEKGKLTQNKTRLATAKAQLAALPAEKSAIDSEVDALTAQEAAQKKANDALKEQSAAKAKKVAKNKEDLDDFKLRTEKVGDLQELAPKMRAANAELAELTEAISSSEAVLADLTARGSATQAEIDSANQKAAKFTTGDSLPDLSTRIRSIYPNWGFVTLAAGNSSGVVNNSTLNVVRGGTTIARLVVTAVEANTASATIIPDSLGHDVTLRAGDRVVPGVKEAKK